MRLCECGCGQPTQLARQTDRKRGWVRGEPVRFIHGHAGRLFKHTPGARRKIAASKVGSKNPNWKGGAVGYYSLHEWLLRNLTKTGVCEECGDSARTEWAKVGDRYTRNRDDYRELCHRCHMRFDGIGKLTSAQVAQIKERLAAGEYGSVLAAEFGVSPSMVSKIKLGQAWV